jgi:hypothetical protein
VGDYAASFRQVLSQKHRSRRTTLAQGRKSDLSSHGTRVPRPRKPRRRIGASQALIGRIPVATENDAP